MLLIDHGHRPPPMTDVYEDWVRPGTAQDDLQIRMQTLIRRIQEFYRPKIDVNGDLVYQGQRLPVSPTQGELAACLVAKVGQLVSRTKLAGCLDGDAGNPDRRNVLDLHMGRLRRKVAPLGLSIRTVWGCGYVLEADRATDTWSADSLAADTIEDSA